MKQEEINKLCDKNKMIYCVDIDGTLFTYPEMKPKKKIINHLKKRHKEGHKIVLLTGRDSKFRKKTELMLIEAGVPYDEIYFDKPKAHIYIDDNTIDINDYLKDMKGYDDKFQEIGNKINKHIREGDGL
jgi:hydroxymethylpyrimidine pyrophosphatase-like HAD family hydrolase